MARIVSVGNVVIEFEQVEFLDLVKLLENISPGEVRRLVGDDYDITDGSLERLYLVLKNLRSEQDA